jgi:hypothetical protein
MEINFQWPKKPGNYYSPWYVIGWRLLWFIPWYVCKCCLVLVTCVAWGPRTAIELWDDLA